MSKSASKVAESIDIAALVPRAPADIFDKAHEAGWSTTQYMVFRRNGKWDKERKRYGYTGRCTACGKNMALGFEEQGDLGPNIIEHKVEVQDYAHIHCPKCHAPVVARDRARISWGYTCNDKCGALVVNRVGDLVVGVGYTLTRTVDKDGKETKTADPTDAYVFGHEKPVRFGRWESWNMNKYLVDEWGYIKTFTDGWMHQQNVIYPFEESLLEGTCLANSKVIEYLNNWRDCRLMKYCQQYLLYPGIENLVTQGYYRIVSDKLSGNRAVNEAVKWREVKPHRMLGLSRPQMQAAKRGKWSADRLFRHHFVQACGMELSEQEVNLLDAEDIYQIKGIAKKYGFDMYSGFRYLLKQIRREKKDHYRHYHRLRYYITEWSDYLQIATELQYDMTQPNVLMPPALMRAHERAVKAKKYVVDEAKRKQFEEMYQKLLPLTWQHGGLLIRPAKDEAELIQEGQQLSHCVGGYGERHIDGKPILFIRRACNPDVPYFTLQLDIKNKRILNNLGYKNNNVSLGGRPRPAAIDEFAQLWLETVVQQYNFDTKKFKRQKKQKQPHNAA